MQTKVLLIDDDEVDVTWISGCLKAARNEYTLQVINSIEDCSSVLDDEFHVILIDARLNDDFFEVFGQDFEHNRPPVIVLGDWEHANLDADSISHNIADFLPKPLLTPILLSHAIKYAMQHNQIQKKLVKLAHYDVLTGAANRRLFLDRFQQTVQLVKRDALYGGLVLIDLDEFKPINDRYGHDAGDHLLKAFCQRVKKVLRKTDTLARLGGDEFAVLLPDVSGKDTLQSVAEKILAEIKPAVIWKEDELFIKASMGLAFFPDENIKLNTTAIYKAADTVLYQVKKSGKNTYQVFEG